MLPNTTLFRSRINDWLDGRGKTVPLRLQLPLKDLPPGNYSTQVNIVDEAGRGFAFQRAIIVILADAPARGAN